MHKPIRKLLATILTLAMLVSLLPIGAAPAQAAGEGESTGAFNVTKNTGSSDNAYTYTNGVLTVGDGADITISMDSSETTPTSDRIVVAENATATITLAGVNIKGSDCDGSQVIAAKSAIDLSNGSILTIDLSANTENTLAGGNGITEGSGAPRYSCARQRFTDYSGRRQFISKRRHFKYCILWRWNRRKCFNNQCWRSLWNSHYFCF